jgi:hypothetical protein
MYYGGEWSLQAIDYPLRLSTTISWAGPAIDAGVVDKRKISESAINRVPIVYPATVKSLCMIKCDGSSYYGFS